MMIVMRRDLKMRKGKIAAQAGHAAIEAILMVLHKEGRCEDIISTSEGMCLAESGKTETPLSEWFSYGCAKICVYVDSEEELMAIGATVGADVPFLVFRGTAFVQGIGDKIERCNPLRPVPVLVAYPHSEKVSTGKAYAAIDARGEFSSTEDFEKMKAAVLAQDIDRIGALSYNIFESVIDESSDIFRIKKEMLVHGAVFSLMSGSGSAVFGVFREESDAEKAAKALAPLAKTFVSSFC